MADRAQRHPWRRWYDTPRWRAIRAQQLAAHPLCAMCQQGGHVRAATVVDHAIAHRGNAALFWDTNNLQSLCKPHHDGPAQSRDRTGRMKGCDVNGRPLDPLHPWNGSEER